MFLPNKVVEKENLSSLNSTNNIIIYSVYILGIEGNCLHLFSVSSKSNCSKLGSQCHGYGHAVSSQLGSRGEDTISLCATEVNVLTLFCNKSVLIVSL